MPPLPRHTPRAVVVGVGLCYTIFMQKRDETYAEYLVRMKEHGRTRKNNGVFWKGRKHSIETRRKQSAAQKARLIRMEYTPKPAKARYVNDYARRGIDVKLWKEAVLKRDQYTCRLCGTTEVKLIADHIKPYSLFPDLRLDLSNGRALCVPCHGKTDTYGRKILKLRKQMENLP